MVREWILVALCLGLGGHLALGVMLHAPGLWDMKNAWWYGLFLGVGVYLGTHILRALWWLVKSHGQAEPGVEDAHH